MNYLLVNFKAKFQNIASFQGFLLGTKRQTNLDPITEWFVLAWDAFEAPRFPYDEALRLARVVGVDLDREIVGYLAQKQSSDLIFMG